jgi:signal recognition particle subunit SRP19
MNRDEIIVWPVYFDVSKSRKEGRRIPKSFAIKSPSIDDIFNACIKLGLEAIIEHDKAFPRTPWEKSGRIIIKKTTKKKSEIILEISEILNKLHRK